MKYSIMQMQEFHAEQVANISAECFSECWSKKAFLDELKNKNSITYVAVAEDNQVIGFVNAHCVFDEGFLNNIAVTNNYRNKKIGLALLKQLINYGVENNISYFTLEVRESNKKAIEFYSKNGFEQVGLRKEFYINPTESAVLLTKMLG